MVGQLNRRAARGFSDQRARDDRTRRVKYVDYAKPCISVDGNVGSHDFMVKVPDPVGRLAGKPPGRANRCRFLCILVVGDARL